MTAPAESEYQQPSSPEGPGIADDALSAEDREELDAFRRMAKLSRPVTREWMERLIRPLD